MKIAIGFLICMIVITLSSVAVVVYDYVNGDTVKVKIVKVGDTYQRTFFMNNKYATVPYTYYYRKITFKIIDEKYLKNGKYKPTQLTVEMEDSAFDPKQEGITTKVHFPLSTITEIKNIH